MKAILTDEDIDLTPLLSKSVAIIGYGNQGRPQALNLRDSGIHVLVGVRDHSTHRETAEADGFETYAIRQVVSRADILMLLLPDETMASVYETEIAPAIESGQSLGFAHGLVIHAGWLKPRSDLNVFLVAPKGQGRGVRQKYLQGSGVPALYAVFQDATGQALQIALAYAKAIGSGRVGVLQTTFKEETECDLFSEQAVLCGGLTRLIQQAFETLIDAGFSPEGAYFECLYEVKLIADLLHEKGIAGMRQAISSTALFGDISRGDRIIDSHVRDNMRDVLQDILSGRFYQEMLEEFAAGKPRIQSALAQDSQHPIEQAHAFLSAYLHPLNSVKM